jgi:hypothetical protein
VITSDTAPQRRALGRAALYVAPGDPHALATRLGALADDRGRLADLRRRAATRAAEAFGPAAVVDPLRRRLGETGR